MSVVLYPYPPLFGDLDLSIDGLTVDGSPPGGDLRDSDYRLVSLHMLERERWEEARLKVSVRGPQDELEAMDADDRELRVVAVSSCRHTNTRLAVELERSGTDPTRWTGELCLPRAVMRDRVVVRAVLTGTADGLPHRWLGVTDDWTVYFDEPAVPPIEGTLRVRWAHFKGDEREPSIPESSEDESFYVALEDKPPVIYLNRDFTGLPDLLSDHRGRPESEKALRDAEYRRTASTAWTEILNVAVAAIREPENDGEEPDWPLEDWQEQALRALLPRIYPDLSDAERLARAHKAVSEGDGALMLQALGQVAVAQQIGAGRSLRRNLDSINKAGGDS